MVFRFLFRFTVGFPQQHLVVVFPGDRIFVDCDERDDKEYDRQRDNAEGCLEELAEGNTLWRQTQEQGVVIHQIRREDGLPDQSREAEYNWNSQSVYAVRDATGLFRTLACADQRDGFQ